MSTSSDKSPFNRTFPRVRRKISKAMRKRKLSEDIHKAVTEYNYEKLSQLIECSSTPDVTNEAGQTPLYLASSDGCFFERDRRMARFLLEKGADFLYYRRGVECTPAAFIFQYEDQELVDLLLSKIENVNVPLDRQKNTALHIAVKCANKTTVLKLLRRGADPNRKNGANKTAMHEAASPGSCHLLRTLVDHGGDINAKGKQGMRPLHLAALSGSGKVLEEVLACKPNVNSRDQDRNTALALFLMDNKNLVVGEIYKFIGAGADLTLRDQHGMNVLHRLVRSPWFPNVEELVADIIDRGVDINAKTSGDHNTPLHLAAQTNLKLVYILLTKKADLYEKNSRGRTPLDNAVFGEHHKIIEMIMSFAVRWNLPERDLMLEYHKTTSFYASINVIRARCLEEFQKADHIKLDSSPRISFKDVLFLDERKLAPYLRNTNFSNQLITNIDHFKSFRYSFRKLYEEAKTRRDAEDAAVYSLYIYWKYRLPLLCVEKIVSKMGTNDLIPFLFV